MLPRNKIIFYKTPLTNVNVDIIYKDETFWLSQKQLAELFGTQIPAITKHIKNILLEEELDSSTISKMEIVQKEGNREVQREVIYYNLDMIIAVGYRINSKEATQFRIWATNTLKEFVIKGFVMDDERIKNGQYFGEDYFKELLERIVSAYFYYVEGIIERKNALTMNDLENSINKFLDFNEYKVLDNFGTISHEKALQKANSEYLEFSKTKKIESDFDKEIKKILKKNQGS